MGRLVLYIGVACLVGFASCDTPSAKHDLTAVEAAVAGYWCHNYERFGRLGGEDLEHLELRPDRTGHWFVSRDGQAVRSNTMLINHWHVSGDSIHLDVEVPRMEIPLPQGGNQVYEAQYFKLDLIPLHLSLDSIILKEVCSLKKRGCDGVQTWNSFATLDEILASHPDSLTGYNPPTAADLSE